MHSAFVGKAFEQDDDSSHDGNKFLKQKQYDVQVLKERMMLVISLYRCIYNTVNYVLLGATLPPGTARFVEVEMPGVLSVLRLSHWLLVAELSWMKEPTGRPRCPAKYRKWCCTTCHCRAVRCASLRVLSRKCLPTPRLCHSKQ